MIDLMALLFGRPHTAANPVIMPKAPPAIHPLTGLPLPQDALSFVETEEDGSPKYYSQHYTHWDWPAGASGPTAGVGYDFGYVTRAEAVRDWTDIVDDATLANMLKGVGLRGEAAGAFVRSHRSEITVTWDQGIAEFQQHEVPKWIERISAALPNYKRLPPECQGAIFSLCYNRGTGGFRDPSQRDFEMREIYQRMASPNFAVTPEYLGPIAGYIAAMARIWPNSADLKGRRAREAALFRKGLEGIA